MIKFEKFILCLEAGDNGSTTPPTPPTTPPTPSPTPDSGDDNSGNNSGNNGGNGGPTEPDPFWGPSGFSLDRP